mgnify:FL=1
MFVELRELHSSGAIRSYRKTNKYVIEFSLRLHSCAILRRSEAVFLFKDLHKVL